MTRVVDGPPRDEALEAAVLGAVFLSPRILRPLVLDEGLYAEAFFVTRNRLVFEAMLALSRRDDGIDERTVIAELDRRGQLPEAGGAAAVEDLTGAVPGVGNFREYARRVLELAELREVQRAAWTLAGGASTENWDEIHQGERMLAQRGRKTASMLTSEALGHLVFDYLATPVVPAFPFPWSKLNEATGGGMRRGGVTLVGGWTGDGKALDVTTPVPTPDGWTTMGELRAGDRVFGIDGRQVRVVHAFPVLVDRNCFEVVFSDGARIVADADHLWTVETRASRRSTAAANAQAGTQLKLGGQDQSHKRAIADTLTTTDLAAMLATQDHRPSIPVAAPVTRPYAEGLPIDPYVLGAWLGDGDARGPILTCHQDDSDHFVAQLRQAGETVRVGHQSGKAHIHRLRFGGLQTCRRGHPPEPDGARCRQCRSIAQRAHTLGVPATDLVPYTKFTATERLRGLGLLQNKHIPSGYLNASVSQRLALLQGLVDTDGTINRAGQLEITFANERLANDCLDLLLGLGVRAVLRERTTAIPGGRVGSAWRIMAVTALPIARLPRKTARLRGTVTTRATHRYVTAVTPVASRPVRCITVDAPDRLFLVGREHIATHNSVITDQVLGHVAIWDPPVEDGADPAPKPTTHLYINEMTPEERALRNASREADVSYDRLLRKQLNDQERGKVLDALKRGLPFGITDAAGWTADEIAHDILWRGWDVAGVDILHNIEYRDERDIAASMQVLTAAALQSRCHLIVTVHLNEERARNSMLPPPVKRDIRGSGMLKNLAHNVVFVYQQRELIDPTDETGLARLTGEASIYLDKQRSGGGGGVDLVFLGDKQRFQIPPRGGTYS